MTLTWTQYELSLNVSGVPGALVYGNGVFVAAINSGIQRGNVITSPDGINWTAHLIPGSSDVRAIAFGNGYFVAIFDNDRDVPSRSAVSVDGINWTVGSLPYSRSWELVAFGGGRFVAVSLDYPVAQVAVSSDGVHWTGRLLDSQLFNWDSITYGNGVFLLAGYQNSVLTSFDGVIWTRNPMIPLPARGPILRVTFNHDVFIAIQWGGSGAVSVDGATWTGFTIPYELWNATAYGRGMFMAVASTASYYRDEGFIAVSVDGTHWTIAVTPFITQRTNVVFGGDRFVTIGYDGLVLIGVLGSPYLRMTQRDDGLGINRAPRLTAGSNNPSSKQSKTPRIGNNNTYR